MRSPPGDIFIYGFHPETTEEDIVNDLKESDIIIEVKDVLKKSKPGSGLNSYKISVKAEDLQKALDPCIWPMRVKVREYIYYAKRPQQQNNGPAGQHGGYGGQTGGQGGYSAQGRGQGGYGYSAQGRGQGDYGQAPSGGQRGDEYREHYVNHPGAPAAAQEQGQVGTGHGGGGHSRSHSEGAQDQSAGH